MEMNIFEIDSRANLAYPSVKGNLASHQLWQMALTDRSGFDLDSVAKAVNSELKALAEESFVASVPSPAKAVLEIKLAVVKHIIAAKLAEQKESAERAQRAAERTKLVGILGDKQDQALRDLKPEELQARIAELS